MESVHKHSGGMSSESESVLKRYYEVLASFPQAEHRPAQERMIREAAEAFENQRSLVIEAGTGSGKSFAYLIPALLQQKRPVVISTATIALQEQLIHKDLPAIIQSLGLTREDGEPLRVKLVKGRGNYVCVQKLLEAERHIKPGSGNAKKGGTNQELMMINYLKGEWQDDWDGDMGSLDLAVPYSVWGEVRSDAEDCLGRKCQFFMENPYRVAREDLDQADVIVANHALYLQDLMAGKTLLPAHEVVIFDEAHQLKNYALGAFTVRIGRYATTKLLQKIQRRLQPIPEEFIRLISDAEAGIMEWLFRSKQETFRLYPDDLFLHLVDRQLSILKDLEDWLGGIDVKQLQIVETDIDADKASVQKGNLLSQLQGMMARWEYFSEHPKDKSLAMPRVNWAEIDTATFYFELKSTPLEVSQYLKESLWSEKTAVLTSATLAVNQSLRFFKAELGVPDVASDSILPSPFDYKKQCLLYLPKGMPDPNTPEFQQQCAEEIERILKITQGRAFVLFTSNSAMKTISNALIPKLNYPCRVQGELPRQKLIDWFKHTTNSVIFATATFWEGIDIPGDALSCVIMDKIPFSPPGDPVNSAVVEHIKQQIIKQGQQLGRDWFNDYALPQAIIKMKQGFGRLIRSKDDTGVVAILDPRVTGKGYGRVIQRSLPESEVVHTLDALQRGVGQFENGLLQSQL